MNTVKGLKDCIKRTLNSNYPAGVIQHVICEGEPYLLLLEVDSPNHYATYNVFLELLKDLNVKEGQTIWDKEIHKHICKYRIVLHQETSISIRFEPEAIAGAGFRVISVEDRVFYIGTVKEIGRHKRFREHNRYLVVADITNQIPAVTLLRVNLKESPMWKYGDGTCCLETPTHVATIKWELHKDRPIQTIETSIVEKVSGNWYHSLFSRQDFVAGEAPILAAKVMCQIFLTQVKGI